MNHTLGRSEHVRRLDVGQEDRSTCQQKASWYKFGHRAKKIGHCAKEIGYCRKITCRLGNMPKEMTMRQRIEQSIEWTNDMLDNIGFMLVIIYLDRVSLDLIESVLGWNNANSIKGQLGLNQCWIGPIVWLIQYPIVGSSGGTARLGDGIAQTQSWRLCQVVVPLD